jgi:monoamine oxidase
VLSGLQKDLSAPVLSAIAAASYEGAGKIGLQFKRRFWDERQRLALEQGAGLHPQYPTEFETAFSVSWPHVP